MEKIERYDCVLIKPGMYSGYGNPVTLREETEGCAVEVYGDQDLFDVDIGTSPRDWACISVKREEILRVTRKASR